MSPGKHMQHRAAGRLSSPGEQRFFIKCLVVPAEDDHVERQRDAAREGETRANGEVGGESIQGKP